MTIQGCQARTTPATASTSILESLIFFSLVGCSRVQNHPVPKGAWRLSSCMCTTRHYGCTQAQVLHVPKGFVCENTSVCYGPHAGFPCRATISAPKGERSYTEEATSGAAPTSPPEEVLRRIRHMELDELSGRTMGRLGYIRPATAYAIGGTATLALRDSIISATIAGHIHYQC